MFLKLNITCLYVHTYVLNAYILLKRWLWWCELCILRLRTYHVCPCFQVRRALAVLVCQNCIALVGNSDVGFCVLRFQTCHACPCMQVRKALVFWVGQSSVAVVYHKDYKFKIHTSMRTIYMFNIICCVGYTDLECGYWCVSIFYLSFEQEWHSAVNYLASLPLFTCCFIIDICHDIPV